MKLNLRVATGHCQWGGASKPLPLPPLSQFTGRGKTAPPVLALMAEDLPLTNEEIRQMQALLPRQQAAQQQLLLLMQPRGRRRRRRRRAMSVAPQLCPGSNASSLRVASHWASLALGLTASEAQ